MPEPLSTPNLREIFPGDGEMARLMRAYDWASTPLGPPSEWSQSLRTVVRVMLGSRFAMWMAWGPELTFFCNDAYSPTLGIKHPWALGKPSNHVWAEIWPDIGPRIEQVLNTGNATWDEALILFLERSGTREETYHTFSYSPAPDDQGQVAGMLCVVSEETDRVIGERRLALLGDLGSGLAAATTEREVFAALEESILERPQDLPFLLAYLFDDHEQANLALAVEVKPGTKAAPRTLTGDETWGASEASQGMRQIVDDLTTRMGEVPAGPWDRAPDQAVVVPIAGAGGERPVGFLVAGLNPYRPFDAAYSGFLDLLTAQIASALANVHAYEAERKRAEELAKLDQAKTAFFSNISHELRTPLTLMLGTLEDSFQRGEIDERDRDNLTVAHRNSLRLLKLVNTLLEFSRIEAGRVQAQYEPVDLASVTADLASNFRSAAERAGLTLRVECEAVDVPVYVDREMWEKVVLNLVSNAFKYTFHGEIAVHLAREGDSAVLRVRDTGTGISPEAQARLFERFYRVEGAAGRTHEGTGIGLALVQELVRLHGGTVGVQSRLGEGSEFSVWIPLGRDHLPPEHVVANSSAGQPRMAMSYVEEALRWLPEAEVAPSQLGEATVVDSTVAGSRIVVADDNADLREYLKRLLTSTYTVEAVTNGEEALEAARRERPDLILTDVMMPKLDGFGLLKAVKSDEALRGVPVIVLSARAGEEARVEGLAYGADDYLVKPFSASELLARVALHIRLARDERRSAEAREELVRQIAVERETLRRIFELAPAFMAVLRGPEFIYDYANAAYGRLVGNRDLIGRKIKDALPEIGSQGFIDLLRSVYQTGNNFVGRGIRVMLQNTEGEPEEEHFLDFVYQPVRDASGEVTAILAHGVDVTEQELARRRMHSMNQELEEAVRSRTSELEEAIRELESFNYSVSHDLRSPLRAIAATSSILLEESVSIDDEHRRMLERQQASAIRLGVLIDELLRFSRLSRQPIERQTVDISAMAESVVEELHGAGQGQKIVYDISPGLTAEADPNQLRLVLHNLLENATKFSPDGGTVTVSEKEGVFSVADQGVGFDMAFKDKLFRPFERLVSDERFPGTGIGLANVDRVVRRHGGHVWAESELGKGARFFFTLR